MEYTKAQLDELWDEYRDLEHKLLQVYNPAIHNHIFVRMQELEKIFEEQYKQRK